MKVLPISSTPSQAEEAQDEEKRLSPELPEACDNYINNDGKCVETPPPSASAEDEADELTLLYSSDEESAKENVEKKSVTEETKDEPDGSSSTVEPSTVDSIDCTAPEAEEPSNTSTTEEPMLVDAEIDEDKLLADDDIPQDVIEKESESVSEDVQVNASEDVQVNASEDMQVNASEDMQVNASEDVQVNESDDVQVNASEDMQVNASEDIQVNSSEDVQVNASEDVTINASEDMQVKESEDVQVNEAEDMQVNASEDVQVNEAEDVQVNASEDVQVNEAEDVKVNASEDVQVNESEDVQVNASEDVKVNASEDMQVNASKDVQFNEAEDVKVNVSEDVQVNASEDVEINSSKVPTDDVEMEPVPEKEGTILEPEVIDANGKSVEKFVEKTKLNGISEAIQKALEEREKKLKLEAIEAYDFLASDSDGDSKKMKPAKKKIRKSKICNDVISNGYSSKSQQDEKSSETELEDKVCDKTSLVDETEKCLSPEIEANGKEQSSPKATEEPAFDEGSRFMDDSIDICSDNEENNTSVANIIKNLEVDDDDDVSLKEKFMANSTENSQTEQPVSNKESKTQILDSETGHFSSIFKNATGKKDEPSCPSPTSELCKPNISDNEDSLVNDKSQQALSPSKRNHESETDSCSETPNEKKEKSSILTIDSDANSISTMEEVNGIDGDEEATTELDTGSKKGIGGKKRSVDPSDIEQNKAKKCKLDIVVKDNSLSENQGEPTSSTATDAPKSTVKVKSPLQAGNMPDIKVVCKRLKRLTRKQLEEVVIRSLVRETTSQSTIASLHQEVTSINEKYSELKKKVAPVFKQVHDLGNVVNRLDQALKKNPKPARPLKVTRSVGLQVTVNNPGPQVGPKVAASPVQQPRGIRTLPPVRPAAANTARSSPSQPLAHSPTQAGKIRVSLPGQGLPGPGMRNFPPTASSAPVSNIVTAAQAQTNMNQARTAAPSIRVNNTIHNFTPMLSTQTNSQNSLNADTDQAAPVRPQQINLIHQPGGKLSIIPPQGGSNTPVAYLLQAPQSRPFLVTPSSPNSAGGRAINSLPIGTVRWLPNLPKTAGTPPNDLQNRQITNTATGQVTVRASNPGVPLQRGSLYTVGPSVASIHRSPTSTVARMHHPAPLPPIPPHPAPRMGWKLPPPKPVLKISKVQNGIVLSWNMTLNSEHEDMKSYQIYAYQESKDPPSSSLWKTVGDVKALALPMACTLTQFKDGHKYHFSVRAVDIHSRMGPHSDPTSIVLVR